MAAISIVCAAGIECQLDACVSASGFQCDGRRRRKSHAHRYRVDAAEWGRFGIELGYSLLLTNKYKQFAGDELIDYRDSWWMTAP